MIAILTRDLLMNFLMGLTALVVLVLTAINPAVEAEQVDQPGALVAIANWPAGSHDVDLWVSSPGDQGVGYKRKSGRVWSLLRDDLGTANDQTPINAEFATTRGLPDGEYAVNVHCYSCSSATPVFVEVRLADGGLVFRGSVDLVPKQERTAVRFRVAGGAVVLGSASSVFKKIRGE